MQLIRSDFSEPDEQQPDMPSSGDQFEDPRLIEFVQYGDERGHLVVVEGGRDIPFDPIRAFYIFGSDADVVRGQHANRYSRFLLVNVSGSSKVRTVNQRGVETVFILDRPHIGVYIPRLVWKEMFDFSEDSVLLVLASTHYDADEYIRDFNKFVEEVGF